MRSSDAIRVGPLPDGRTTDRRTTLSALLPLLRRRANLVQPEEPDQDVARP